MIARNRPARHGVVAIAMVVILVIGQLILVGSLVAGTRDLDTTVQRLDSARAFYACEAGMNMGIRETMTGSDGDGNGGIGSIASKSIGSATTVVTISGSGTVTMTGTGAAGICRCKASASLTAAGNTLSQPIIYGDNTTTPKYRMWVSPAWSAALSTSALDNIPTTMVVRVCPTRNEWIAAVDDNGGNPQAMFFNGTSWINKIQISSVNLTYRSYSVAYEQQSGDGLMACWDGGSGEPKYRAWSGSAWSASQSSSVSLNNTPNWVKLIAKKASNEIIMLCLDSNATLRAGVWTGSRWTNISTLAAGLSSATTEDFDGAYEGASGNFLAVWGGGGAKTWDGTSWAAAAAPPNASGTTRWVRLGAAPSSNSIVCLMLDSGSNVTMSMWNGSSWTASTTWATTAANTDRRNFDVCWEPTGGHALAVYTEAANTPFYRVWDGTSWGAEQTAPDISSPSNFIQVMPATSGQQILAGFYRRSDKALVSLYWNGSSLAGLQTLAASMGGSGTTEVFMIGDHPFSSSRVASWALQQP